jgi:hypothetical protein
LASEGAFLVPGAWFTPRLNAMVSLNEFAGWWHEAQLMD